ncbi:MAG TPA: hypothetical protein VHD63_03295 [Ktedonobacteraceae bacterium]|nr:hypothetical protein [Ktedonobacteraceae bacterium]
MRLYLLEIVYTVEKCEAVEGWLARTDLGGVVISTEQYDEEILAVLASERTLEKAYLQAWQHPFISSCEEKQRMVYRVTTASDPQHALCSFPFRPGEEWYAGSANMMYLSVQARQLSEKQLCWLAENTAITRWEHQFDLVPVLPVPLFTNGLLVSGHSHP